MKESKSAIYCSFRSYIHLTCFFVCPVYVSIYLSIYIFVYVCYYL